MKRKGLGLRSFSSMFGIAALAASLGVACTSETPPEEDGGKGGAGGDTNEGTGGEKPGTGGTAQGGEGGSDSGLACEAPTSVCGDTCVNLKTSFDHCGECDSACEGSQACQAGTCKDRLWTIAHTSAGMGALNPIVQVSEKGEGFVVSRNKYADTALTAWLIKKDGFALDLPGVVSEEVIDDFRFAMNTKGKGFVAFVTKSKALYASSFDGEIFGDPKLVDASEKGVGYSPYIDTGFSLTVEEDGSATIVYPRFQSGTSGSEDVYSVRTSGPTKAWGTPVPVDAAADDVIDLHVASNGKGSLLATWVQANKVLVSLYEDGSWSEPKRISGEDLYAAEPRVAFNPDGKAVVVFKMSEMIGDGDVWRAIFDGDGWTEPSLLVESDANEEHPGVALRPDGSGIYSYKVKGGADEDDKVFAIPFEKATEALGEAEELTSTPIVGQFPRPFVGPGRSGGVHWSNMEDYNRTRFAFTEGKTFTEWEVPLGLYMAVIPSVDFNTVGDGFITWHDSSPSLGYRAYEVP